MTDSRGQEAPPQDRSTFYAQDVTALPLMQGPEDMPAPTDSALWNARRTLAQTDRPDARRERMRNLYKPMVEAINARRGVFDAVTNPGSWLDMDLGERTFWANLKAERAKDPTFLKDFGDSPADAYARQIEREKRERAAAAAIAGRARGIRQGVIGLAADITEGTLAPLVDLDPLTGATFAVGGGGRTVAQRIITEGLANAGVAAVTQPIVAANRAEVGETLTIGEAATNVAVAGIGGMAIQGGIIEPLGAVFRRVVGKGATEAEQAALWLIEREDERAASSPFKPGPGTDAHLARLDEATAKAAGGERPVLPRPIGAPDAVANPAMAPRETLKAAIRSAESSGNDAAANPNSSAVGRYQFTAPTWKRYYIKRYGRGGMTDDAILAKRADPATQEALMDDLLADNSAALARGGFRQTAGNLYLMHFAGEGGGLKVLRAAPDMPIEDVLGKAVVEANPFLKGRTAGEVVEWAQVKMGQIGGEGPTLRREGFGSNDEWNAAQREIDAAEADRAAAMARLDALDGATPEDAMPDMAPRWTAIDPNEHLRDAAWLTGDAAPAPARSQGGDLFGEAPPRRRLPQEPPKRDLPSDVIEFIADRGGLRDTDGHDLRGMIDQRAPHRLLRKSGMTIGDASEMLAEAGYFLEQPRESDVIDMIDRALRGEKIYPLKDQADMIERARISAQAEDTGLSEMLSDRLGIDRAENPRLFDDVMVRVADGEDPWYALENATADAVARGESVRAAQPAFDPSEPVPGFDEMPLSSQRLGDEWGDPFEGPAARTATDSIEHDVAMLAQADPESRFETAEDGGRTVRDLFDELDADDSAINAARSCMAPPGVVQ